MAAMRERADAAYWAGALALALAYLAWRVAEPFLGPLVGAATVAVVLFPLRARLLRAHPERGTAVAFLLTALAFLTLVLPVFFGILSLVDEGFAAYPAVRDWARTRGIEPRGLLLQNAEAAASYGSHFVSTALRNAAGVVMGLAVFAAALFVFLRDGDRIALRAVQLAPMARRRAAAMLERVLLVLRAIVLGVFIVGLIQGALAWIGLAVIGVPYAALLAGFCVVLSPIPFLGTGLVWVPVALKLGMGGDWTKAAAVTAWFCLVVGLSDNVARPLLIGANARIPIPLVFIGVLGGLSAFGPSGLVLGPVIVALMLSAAGRPSRR